MTVLGMTVRGMMLTFDQARDRFLAGFAARANLDPAQLRVPGTTLVARDDRTGTGIVTCYWADQQTVVWLDPQLMDLLAGLEHPAKSASAQEIDRALVAAGFEHIATADMRVLDGPPANVPAPLARYELVPLAPDAPETLVKVREFADRCDPDDVEEAGLEDLDNFHERAINVLTAQPAIPGQIPGPIVAYASACDWDWDDGFTDVGVLVDGQHRGLGLGRYVVANTVQQLLDDGRLPLYRHGHGNPGSQAIAIGLGFRPATTLGFYKLPEAESSPSEVGE